MDVDPQNTLEQAGILTVLATALAGAVRWAFNRHIAKVDGLVAAQGTFITREEHDDMEQRVLQKLQEMSNARENSINTVLQAVQDGRKENREELTHVRREMREVNRRVDGLYKH